jgi:hypothetical protein
MSRIETKKIASCRECRHFDTNYQAHGDARYSCNHPNGPGGRLTWLGTEEIHEDCPLPESIGNNELIEALKVCNNYFEYAGQGNSEELARQLINAALENYCRK